MQLQRAIRHWSTWFAWLPLLCGGINLALAEGAVRVLECKSVQLCDTTGTCAAAAGEVVFRMTPVSVDADGAGSFTMQYDSSLADMQALSGVGPWYWVSRQQRHTLLASSDTRFVWHTLSLTPEPEAQTRFLNCSFRL